MRLTLSASQIPSSFNSNSIGQICGNCGDYGCLGHIGPKIGPIGSRTWKEKMNEDLEKYSQDLEIFLKLNQIY